MQLPPFIANTFSVAFPILMPNASAVGSAKFVTISLITGDKISSTTRLRIKFNSNVVLTNAGLGVVVSTVLENKVLSSALTTPTPAVVV